MNDFFSSLLNSASLREHVGTLFFICAVLQTFLAHKLIALSHRFPAQSLKNRMLHIFGEVELAFAIWAVFFMVFYAVSEGATTATNYLKNLSFAEPSFVFVIMAITSSKPVVVASEKFLGFVSKALPFQKNVSLYATTVILGSLLGSVLTEPAAMTVTALVLRKRFFTNHTTLQFKYLSLGLLFVAVSIGGTLTHFAAPPVLMVSKPWGWDTAHMFLNFGWKAALAIVFCTAAMCVTFRKQLSALPLNDETLQDRPTPLWLSLSHFAFVTAVVIFHASILMTLIFFALFMLWTYLHRAKQDAVDLKGSGMVALFLAGLVTLGGVQSWWLKPLLQGLDPQALFWGATALTAITDNAALTYLGSLVPNLSEAAKYMLLAGAVTGGGLTVIANAPNPAGYRILAPSFGSAGVSPVKLALAALPFTLIAALFFLFL